MKRVCLLLVVFLTLSTFGCDKPIEKHTITAKEILGNPTFQAISYGGYRELTREIQPTTQELKEDMKILQALGLKILRTYNVHYAQAENLLKAIKALKEEDDNFEMYVMLGAWIDCKNAFDFENGKPNHEEENERNALEIKTAVKLSQQYPDIVKILAVGNEAMVRWATSYYVQPKVILKWVNHLQDLKKEGDLPINLWITSSDDYLSWGGGDPSYHTDDLNALIKAVDFVSMHTYPMHNSYYNPEFWEVPVEEQMLPDFEKINRAMERAIKFAQIQFQSVSDYVKSIDSTKTVHIGESGWASASNGFYGRDYSNAADEYKAGEYYRRMRAWTNEAQISLFYFEIFDEQWKDAANPGGSENHFGLINLEGQAKFALWDLVEDGTLNGLKRDGKTITKTHAGDFEVLREKVLSQIPVH